ncbi:MAG: S-adenosylmethionine:tRNA ribosyltransferase-isomerase, partial [Chitinophagaceae bacterium]
KIAYFPLNNREQSKLLVFQNNIIKDYFFYELPTILPPHTLLVCNNSKVFQARLIFPTNTPKPIEIFCMEILHMTNNCATIKCMIGNNAKWKKPTLTLEKNTISLQAQKIKPTENDLHEVLLQWNNTKNIFEMFNLVGQMPLPPYIKRSETNDDKSTYQTIFANEQGSVAAPTAGLHFTDKIKNPLHQKNISFLEITLHVGGGTFLPIKTDYINQHRMHSEQVIFSKKNILHLVYQLEKKYPICAVGTTSLRSLESLHSLGILLYQKRLLNIENIEIPQWLSFEDTPLLSYVESLKLILNFLEIHQKEEIRFKTKICIIPGYTIQSANYLITNFHQPRSTLLLLIAAIVGEEWKNIYHHALSENYRFLSYGDASLLEIKL